MFLSKFCDLISIIFYPFRLVLMPFFNMIEKLMFLKCLNSPSLYMLLRNCWERYNPNDFERFGENCLFIIQFCKNLGLYTSPLIMLCLYRRGYFCIDGMMSLTKLSVSLGVIISTSYCIRSYGRINNPRYTEFLSKLDDVKKNPCERTLKNIKNYDFEFESWPVEYEYNQSLAVPRRQDPSGWRSSIASIIRSPCSVIGYMVIHTFGIRMIYPGSTSILNYILFNVLLDGRKALIEGMNGIRYKLKTKDANYIDTMFVDKRPRDRNASQEAHKGNTLVICSEGNAGFYENGIMPTAINADFSVLGWNHPGFGCSTGMPYLDQEQNAMETVMQFAIHKLGFPPNQIILYGWSIGGYSTTWAARHYTDVKAVVLDATFDDILPLAVRQMPDMLEPLVKMTIRCYADLNVAENLADYHGPVKLIRRSQDEIIATDPGNLATNRGNMLLTKLLKRRYPQLINNQTEKVLYRWLITTAADQGKFQQFL
ncbi:hypothetical protein O3M35_002141 [Rhynocoris fuscipes]|uniref:AB hydrolase-1 domain-containing protein n=1 Tax=Rhynocoris fuscipes TaxID=488301 RepID=A0AAW1CRF9_9HEMI